MDSVIYKKIPLATKSILDLFIQKNFKQMSIDEIAIYLHTDENTITQRILRDNGTFFIEINKRPKIIKVKPKLPEVVFHKYKNQCMVCKLKRDTKDLVLHEVNSENSENDDYSNLYPICVECKSKNFEIPKTPTQKPVQMCDTSKFQPAWEYLTVLIRFVKDIKLDSLEEGYRGPFIEFFEITNERSDPDTQEWSYLELKNGDKSPTQTCLLNHYGNQGWELLHIEGIAFNPPILDINYEYENYGYNYCFKRMKKD